MGQGGRRGHGSGPALPAECRGWVQRGSSRPPCFLFQIVLLSSSLSDRDQSLFLSTDEGATFQKQLIPFSVETLIFHPKEEDKVLAYTKEGKVNRGGAGVWAPGHPQLLLW